MSLRVVGFLLALPLVGLALLLAVPGLDVEWQHHPSHFWLVLGVALVNVVLGLATSEAAARRDDTRTFLVSLALLVSAGFLGLHALATPGVLLAGPNAGFTMATPVGLVLAAGLAWASTTGWADAPLRHGSRRGLRAVVLLVLVGWAVASLAHLPVLEAPVEQEVPPLLRVAAPAAVVLYAIAAVRWFRVAGQRRQSLPLAVAVAFVLLAEAMIAIVFSRSWHASWWEWHVLMALAFGAIFLAARAEYRRAGSVAEAFTGLYLDRTLALVDVQSSRALSDLGRALRDGAPLEPVRARLRAQGLTGERIAALEQAAAELHRVDALLHHYVGDQLAETLVARPDLADLGGRQEDVTVLFADLVGFTAWSESRPPEDGMTLLNTYWAAVVPAIVDDFGGVVERFAGDGIVVIFNTLGDQPDHADRAVRAALFVQDAIEGVIATHPDWPRFRIGINTGPAMIGNVGADQRRNFTVIGDTANTAARFEALAGPGHVLTGRATRDRLLDGSVTFVSRGTVALKGKAEPQEVYEAVHDDAGGQRPRVGEPT